MNTTSVDLNLLHAFHAVHAEGSVTRAAERLGVSQPTVSHALTRLRHLYRDPLFVRTQGGMAPTAKADRLAEAVRQALHVLDVAIQEGARYEPAASDRTFRLHMSDIGETIFLPRLLRSLAERAPGVRLETFQYDDKDIGPALESGRIDLAVGYVPALVRIRADGTAVGAVCRGDAGRPPARVTRADARCARHGCVTPSCAPMAQRNARSRSWGSPPTSAFRCRTSSCCRESSPKPILPS